MTSVTLKHTTIIFVAALFLAGCNQNNQAQNAAPVQTASADPQGDTPESIQQLPDWGGVWEPVGLPTGAAQYDVTPSLTPEWAKRFGEIKALAAAGKDAPVPMKPDTRAVLVDGMTGSAQFGTASAFKTAGVSALAKTGTIVMEMTRSQNMMFHLLAATLLASFVARQFCPRPFYHAASRNFRREALAVEAASEKAAKA